MRGDNFAGDIRRAAGVALLLCAAGAMLVRGGIAAQRQTQPAPALPNAPDAAVIDFGISEMLAGWQIGDVELMHKMYAENVVVVSGMFEPPIVGWAAYSQAYKRQRDRIQSPRLERFNTLTTVRGNVAWVAYQWAFTAVEGTQQIAARGHTSLVLEKQGGKWLIVHNHTSVVPEQLTPPAQTPAQPPPKPGR